MVMMMVATVPPPFHLKAECFTDLTSAASSISFCLYAILLFNDNLLSYFPMHRLHDLREVAIVVRHFSYQGEGLRAARGTLAAVTARVPQVTLPNNLSQALASELDTGGSAAHLLRVLEMAAQVVGNGYGGSSSSSSSGGISGTSISMVNHVAATEAVTTMSEGAGGGLDHSPSHNDSTAGSHRGVALDPHTLLTTFVESVLLVPPLEWAALCPLVVRRSARLQHLRDLLLAVEARSLGHLSPAHGVADKFKQPISGVRTSSSNGSSSVAASDTATPEKTSLISGEWAAALAALPASPVDRATCLGPVLGAFRDLLAGPLADPSDFSATESLRLFLTYQDDDLLASEGSSSESWFCQHFPSSLRLEHALEAYLALAASANDSIRGGGL